VRRIADPSLLLRLAIRPTFFTNRPEERTMRLILYTGKGGVGKSSLAAATASLAAARGRSTLLVSSDAAHNLGDIFDTPVGGETTRVAERLTLLEVDPLREIRENWQPVQDYLVGLLESVGMENPIAEEFALLPGITELFLLTRVLREVESGQYEVVIVDCSPTAGTLRHLTLTDTASTKLERFIHFERQVLKLIRPMLRRVRALRGIIPEDALYDTASSVIRKVGRLGEILKDTSTSSVRLVLNPDRIAIAETRRAFTYFGLFGFSVDGVFVNKVLPEDLAEGYLHDWYALQQELLDSIAQSFLHVTQFRVPLLEVEPIGRQALLQMGARLFCEHAPDDRLSPDEPFTIQRDEHRYRLAFYLPHVAQEDLDLGRKDSELILRARDYTRVITLPGGLADRRIAGARFEDERLTVTFEAETS
jgi:arsenite-transporting ATPase